MISLENIDGLAELVNRYDLNELYYCGENGCIYTIDELRADYEELKKEDRDTYAMETFETYMNDCLSKNGALDPVIGLASDWGY